ncbi:hypothetical protein HC248_01969 [Polaromonas vacuolata]|uniref:Uncharacterized protein n=1 Tax=Polaromonas vacuolata TaxID=37448 RepID=A0A6H2HA08_9BURK|nr:hypothetical protein [Polaromonas vacuolata]QJC56660.1 hypothetical protein HC248_01969 [Polaromonas vacuolata]
MQKARQGGLLFLGAKNYLAADALAAGAASAFAFLAAAFSSLVIFGALAGFSA